MKILDLTSSLDEDKHNYYYFNGSIVHYYDNMFILVYRQIIYNLPIVYHPWDIWNSFYNKFPNNNVINKKFRDNVGGSIEIKLDENKQVVINDEYDSTNLAIIKYSNNKFEKIYDINNIFQDEMNQDTRIIKRDDKYILSYNSYQNINNHKTVVMRTRMMNIDNTKIYLSEEKEMFKNIKTIEKNCVYDLKNNIIYELFPYFTIFTNSKIIHNEFKQFNKLIDYYGRDNVLVSVGTPSIKFDNNYLAISHIKVKYNKLKDKYPFKYFYDSINFNDIKQHGNFIYFMMFYLYDENYEIIKISNPFIPSINMCHLPWLLAFPMSIIFYNDEYIISYGEGDCRIKILTMTYEEIKQLLVDDFDLGFYFLTDYKKIIHYGYYNEMNCGDDMFKLVFNYLHNKYYPYYEITFQNKINKNDTSDLIIVGGGDLINPYFIEPVKNKKNMIAVGIGIPYVENIKYLSLFKNIIIRNKIDYNKLKDKYNILYYPDLGFMLSKIFKLKNNIMKDVKHIGICLSQTYYHSSYENEYYQFIKNICICIGKLLNDKYIIHLIPFCINNKINENDIIIIKNIQELIKHKNLIVEYDNTYTENNYIELINKSISNLDFCICTRFHAHIFCIINNIPFISLSCTRKCVKLMYEIGLKNNLYKLETNETDIPINFDGNMFYNFVISKIKDLGQTIRTINHISKEYEILMNLFEDYWKDLIYTLLNDKIIISLYPKFKDDFTIQKIIQPSVILDLSKPIEKNKHVLSSNSLNDKISLSTHLLRVHEYLTVLLNNFNSSSIYSNNRSLKDLLTTILNFLDKLNSLIQSIHLNHLSLKELLINLLNISDVSDTTTQIYQLNTLLLMYFDYSLLKKLLTLLINFLDINTSSSPIYSDYLSYEESLIILLNISNNLNSL